MDFHDTPCDLHKMLANCCHNPRKWEKAYRVKYDGPCHPSLCALDQERRETVLPHVTFVNAFQPTTPIVIAAVEIVKQNHVAVASANLVRDVDAGSVHGQLARGPALAALGIGRQALTSARLTRAGPGVGLCGALCGE